MMRDEGSWIDTAINIVLVICAIGAVVGLFVAGHFIVKFW